MSILARHRAGWQGSMSILARHRPAMWERFPFFDHLTLAEVQESHRLERKLDEIGLTTSEVFRLRVLRGRSYPKREGQ